MVIVRSAVFQKTLGDLGRLLLKCFTPNRVHSPSNVHIVFDNCTDNQKFSIKQTKRVIQAVGQGKRLQGNATGRGLQRFFKKQFKQDRSHKTIQRIGETRDTTKEKRKQEVNERYR